VVPTKGKKATEVWHFGADTGHNGSAGHCSCSVKRFSNQQIYCALYLLEKANPSRKDPSSVVFLPFVGTTYYTVRRILSKHNIKTIGFPPRKIPGFHKG
jgi:hypothetical protein